MKLFTLILQTYTHPPTLFTFDTRQYTIGGEYQIGDPFHSNISNMSPLSSLTQIGH